MEAHVTDRSQGYRLEQRAREAKVRHGEEVRADIPNVRVAPAHAFSGRFGWPRRADSGGEIFFCEIGPLHIREIVVEGDDAPLPSTVVVEGLGGPAVVCKGEFIPRRTPTSSVGRKSVRETTPSGRTAGNANVMSMVDLGSGSP